MSLKLGRCVGEGGFGAVYIGMWHGQRCAVKRFYLRGQDKLIEREISLVKNLRHRHIIQFLATETYEDSLVMITDFAEGGTLQSAIQGKRLGDGWVKKDQISKEIAKGLAYIHSNKIIHRDLKSGNVLLTQYLEVKLCDFGLAQIKINTASSHTSDRGSAEGTLRWMAPEVLALRPKYSTKSDMYALGMVMWEMAANCTTPFQEQRDNNVVVGFVRQGDREEIPEKTPMDYRLWIERCWEQDPSRRPDAADMFDENIDDVGFASESQVSTVSITMSMVDRGGLTRESEAPIGSGNIGGSGNSDTTKSAAPHGLSANLLAKLSTLEGDDAERVRGMLSIFEGTSYNVPPPIVEELELIVTSGEQLLRDAKLGDVDAHYKLGRKYIQALGVEPRYESGKKLLELAASQGHAEARFQYSLMICFRHATGSDDDWLEEAAADGHASAATLLHFARNVGNMMSKDAMNNFVRTLQEREARGDAIASLCLGATYYDLMYRDLEKGRRYFERATMQGLVDGAYYLGIMCQGGEGGPVDLVRARKLFTYAANRWHPGAQFRLGVMFRDGRGDPRDRHKAAMLFLKAAQQGHPDSEAALRDMNL